MPNLYTPRQMPARLLEGAPDIVRRKVLDLFAIVPASPLDFDVILKPERGPFQDTYVTGLDFGRDGSQGCHFELKAHAAQAYRERNRRHRLAWSQLPAPAQRRILAYLTED